MSILLALELGIMALTGVVTFFASSDDYIDEGIPFFFITLWVIIVALALIIRG